MDSMQLAPHQQRVVDEKAELDARIVLLDKFIGTNPIFGGLPEVERMALYSQYRVMKQLSAILGERIARFGA